MRVELTPQTLDLLKNFSTINSSILLSPGNTLMTISEMKNVIAQADVEEEFPIEFGIWNLPGFIGVVSAFENPVLTFSEETNSDGTSKFVVISEKDGKGQFKYFGSPKNVLKTVMSKTFNMPDSKIKFQLTKNILQKCLRSASMGELQNIIVESDGNEIDIVVKNKDTKTSNEYRINVSNDGNGDKFHLVFDTTNLKLIPGTYDVSMDGKIVSEFKNLEKKLTYYIANEKSSQYG